jgi:hypothetical protein
MSKILNGEGRVFGCLSAAEQQELKDAAKVSGARIEQASRWDDATLHWIPLKFVECLWGVLSAYRVTLPAAPVTCPVCGKALVREADGEWVCYESFGGCGEWTQEDEIQRPKRPEQCAIGHHYEWRLDGVMPEARWIAVPDAPAADHIADTGKMVAPAPETVPVVPVVKPEGQHCANCEARPNRCLIMAVKSDQSWCANWYRMPAAKSPAKVIEQVALSSELSVQFSEHNERVIKLLGDLNDRVADLEHWRKSGMNAKGGLQ